jgi:hypothetical protein
LIAAGDNFFDTTVNKFCYKRDDGSVIDLGLRQYRPVTYDRFLERRQHIYQIYNNFIHRTLQLLHLEI